jgi:hypothetical protein
MRLASSASGRGNPNAPTFHHQGHFIIVGLIAGQIARA